MRALQMYSIYKKDGLFFILRTREDVTEYLLERKLFSKRFKSCYRTYKTLYGLKQAIKNKSIQNLIECEIITL